MATSPNTFPTFRIVRLCETGVEYLSHRIKSLQTPVEEAIVLTELSQSSEPTCLVSKAEYPRNSPDQKSR